MRILALDYFRGFFIILVLIFSLWQWMYSDESIFSVLIHNRAGEFHIGDLIFPIFLFASGISLSLYINKLKHKKRKIHMAERKYLNLLLIALLLSMLRLFQPFPDEVMIIAISDLIILNVVWGKNKNLIYLFSALFALSITLAPVVFPIIFHNLTKQYLGGVLAFIYYSLITAFGSICADYCFSDGHITSKTPNKILKFSSISFILTLFSSLFFTIDKMNLSISFIFFSTFISSILFLIFIWLFDIIKFRIDFLEVLGKNSLSGWALYYLASSAVWYLGLIDKTNPTIYLPLCFFLLVSLYFALRIYKKQINPYKSLSNF